MLRKYRHPYFLHRWAIRLGGGKIEAGGRLLIVASFRTQSKGFSLLELIVAVGILAVMASIAIPAYSRYQKDVQRSEATRMLLQTLRAQQEIPLQWAARSVDTEGLLNTSSQSLEFCTSFKFTEFFESSDPRIPTLPLRFPGARYNIILGRTSESCLSESIIGASELSMLEGYGHLFSGQNDFGVNSHVRGFVIGAERDVGQGKLDVLFVSNHGQLYVLCDRGEEMRAGAEAYSGATNGEPVCRRQVAAPSNNMIPGL